MYALATVIVGDPAEAWRSAGFRVDGDLVVVDHGLAIRCSGAGDVPVTWELRADDEPVPSEVAGLGTAPSRTPEEVAPPAHDNGVVGLDHLVLRSPDLDRTTEALGDLGLDLRRTRDVPVEPPFQQRFFRLAPTILELIGPPAPEGEGPTTIWGFAFVVDDIDATARALGDRCSTPKDAVQPGRRIATLRTEDLGISLPVAFMTPHMRNR